MVDQVICDLSRDNVPNASRSNAEQNGKRTGDERLGKQFETGTVNGWTANFRLSNGWGRTDKRLLEFFEWVRSNG